MAVETALDHYANAQVLDLEPTVPQWFLDNCIKISAEFATSKRPLVVRDTDDDIGDAGDHSTEESDSPDQQLEIDTLVYEPLLTVVSNRFRPRIDSAVASEKLKHDAVQIRLLQNDTATSIKLSCRAVAESLARDVGANLVAMDCEDFLDLWQHFSTVPLEVEERFKRKLTRHNVSEEISCECEGDYDPWFMGYPASPNGKRDTKMQVEKEEDAKAIKPAAIDPAILASRARMVSCILEAGRVKSAQIAPAIPQEPVSNNIIFLANIHRLLDLDQWGVIRSIRDANLNALLILADESKPDLEPSSEPYTPYHDHHHDDDLHFVLDRRSIRTPKKQPGRYDRFEDDRRHRSRSCLGRSDATVLAICGRNPRPGTICIVPSWKASQPALCASQPVTQGFTIGENIRWVQRAARRISARHNKLSCLQPYADWHFLVDTPAETILCKAEIDDSDLLAIVESISQTVKDTQIEQAILNFGRRRSYIDSRIDKIEQNNLTGQWSTFSKELQAKISAIEQDSRRYRYEQKLLHLLIAPDTIENGWSDIALDQEAKDCISRLIKPIEKAAARGVLKSNRIGGALLYGLPGTGKTLLARVLARECKTTMICVSPADLGDSFVGNSEKLIKGLFSLAKELSPCAIFFDEADALFRSRRRKDCRWEVSMLNQLLAEMDGIRSSPDSPFVILASNHPQELDHAVLRRAPCRIYIKLPSEVQRRQILEICLREEHLDVDVDLEKLAERTHSYSGSDLKSVCVQAALACDTLSNDNPPIRLLKAADFETAVRRNPATTSSTLLAALGRFAQEFDPTAAQQMKEHEEQEYSRQELSRRTKTLEITFDRSDESDSTEEEI